jgi:phosphatidylinositol alpha-1,6-mannosyltransferase
MNRPRPSTVAQTLPRRESSSSLEMPDGQTNLRESGIPVVAKRPVEVLGLFPRPDSGSFGGVQLSGMKAWEAITDLIGETRARALFYERGSSKLRTVVAAVGEGRTADILFVWHLHLLKLLPVLQMPTAKIVLFLHGIEAWRRHGALMQVLLTKVDLFLANTEFTWTQFRKCNPKVGDTAHRVTHLGTGLPLRSTTPSPAPMPAVLMIGRLDRGEDYKGHRQMIGAWRHVVERIPSAKLWVIGDGNLRPDLEDLARRNAPPHSVDFFGKAPDARKEQLLTECRCLALPSRGEGFGLVYLEAMRMGRPCLVSNADAGREVVNPPEAGLAVDPDDPAQIADAVSRMLTEGSEWDEWSRRARARYESRFTAEHFRRRLIAAIFDS